MVKRKMNGIKVLAGTLALFSAGVLQANEANISTGKPSKDAVVTVTITLTGPNGEKEEVSWTASITKTDSPEDKARKIRDAAPPATPPANVTIGGPGNVVKATSGAGWTIKGMGFTKDGTNEKDTSNVFALSLDDQRGLVSLGGVAEGFDPDGNPGYVNVFAGGAEAFVETLEGMTAEEIEMQIIQQLQDQGLPARWANSEDNLAKNFPGLEGDGVMAFLGQIDPAGLVIDVKDNGLTLDVGGLIDVSVDQWVDCLRLDVRNLVAGQRADFVVAGGQPGGRALTVYGLQAGQTVLNNVFDYCATFGIRGVSSGNVLGGLNRSFDDTGMMSFGVSIPANASGITVLFQSAAQGTCPDECMSNRVELTVQ